jgi:antitoxin component of MazEF toxin-antitoxin module
MKEHIKEQVVKMEKGLGIQIPDEYAKYLNLHQGSLVDVKLDKAKDLLIISHISESEDIVKRYIPSAETMA